MRNWIYLLLLSALALPALAARHVDLKHFNQQLTEAKGKSDEDLAHWLSDQQLGERMTAADLAHLTVAMPGPLSKRALTMVADESAFLPLPSDQLPKTAPMSAADQQQALTLASVYIEKTLAKLPNFFATESITTYEDTPASKRGNDYTPAQRMHYADFRRASVRYHGGREVMELQTKKAEQEVTEEDQTISANSGLLSSGEFGPVLRTVLNDAKAGKLAWSHWEPSPDAAATAPVAVFRYSVPRKASHYRLKVELPGHSSPSPARPGYHGEIAIDPASGTIARITLIAETTDDDPMSQADLLVEYGPVTIGEQSYICPVRSIARTRIPLNEMVRGGNEGFEKDPHSQDQSQLNNVVLDHYQLLRSDAKILTGADMNDDGPKADAPQ